MCELTIACDVYHFPKVHAQLVDIGRAYIAWGGHASYMSGLIE